MKKELNSKDRELLAYCYDNEKSINEIARKLKIAPASVVSKTKKLKNLKLIKLKRGGQGKKTYIRTIKGDKTEEFENRILKDIKKSGGKVALNQYAKLPLDITEEEQEKYLEDLLTASMRLLHSDLLKQEISLTKKGQEFLKKND